MLLTFLFSAFVSQNRISRWKCHDTAELDCVGPPNFWATIRENRLVLLVCLLHNLLFEILLQVLGLNLNQLRRGLFVYTNTWHCGLNCRREVIEDGAIASNKSEITESTSKSCSSTEVQDEDAAIASIIDAAELKWLVHLIFFPHRYQFFLAPS